MTAKNPNTRHSHGTEMTTPRELITVRELDAYPIRMLRQGPSLSQ